MEKGIIFFCSAFAILSLTACGDIKENDSIADQLDSSVGKEIASNAQTTEKVKKKVFTDFIYDVSSRFNVIKKGDLDKARAFSDFIGEEHAQRIVSYKYLNVTILGKNQPPSVKEITHNGILTTAQTNLLQSLDYSTNVFIEAGYVEKNIETGHLEDSHSTPYLTIVPEKQATYMNGKAALMKYLKDNSEHARTNVEAGKLRPAKLFFTVTKDGAIENVNLDRSSGYPLVDDTMIELITKTSNAWQPAENAKGEKVGQELVVSFGLMGC